MVEWLFPCGQIRGIVSRFLPAFVVINCLSRRIAPAAGRPHRFGSRSRCENETHASGGRIAEAFRTDVKDVQGSCRSRSYTDRRSRLSP